MRLTVLSLMLAILAMLVAPLGCGQLKPTECNDAPSDATLSFTLNASTVSVGYWVLGTVVVKDAADKEMNNIRVTVYSAYADGTYLQFYYADTTPASSTFSVCTDDFGTYTFSIGAISAPTTSATITAFSGANFESQELTVQ